VVLQRRGRCIRRCLLPPSDCVSASDCIVTAVAAPCCSSPPQLLLRWACNTTAEIWMLVVL
jgi:hypothetical protein